jgi:hypothetical protein
MSMAGQEQYRSVETTISRAVSGRVGLRGLEVVVYAEHGGLCTILQVLSSNCYMSMAGRREVWECGGRSLYEHAGRR